MANSSARMKVDAARVPRASFDMLTKALDERSWVGRSQVK